MPWEWEDMGFWESVEGGRGVRNVSSELFRSIGGRDGDRERWKGARCGEN